MTTPTRKAAPQMSAQINRKPPSSRPPVLPYASALVIVELLPDTRVFVDDEFDMPVLVTSSGGVEMHMRLPVGQVTMADVSLAESLVEATAAWRTCLIDLL